MAIVVAVRGVVDSVVRGTHDRPDLPVDAIVNVGGPYAFHEQEDYVCSEMHWNYKERYNVR